MSARWMLAMLLATALTTAGCSGLAGGTPEPCDGVHQLQLGSGQPTPVCKLTMGLTAVAGSPMLAIGMTLPPSGPYGSGRDQALLIVRAYQLGRPAENASAMLYLGRSGGGLFVTDGPPLGASGPCVLDRRTDGLGLRCDLTRSDGTRLPLSGRLPPAPDPRSDPDIRWLEVEYRFEGDYSAAATSDSAIQPGELDGGFFQIHLRDGSLLTVAPKGNDEGKVAWLSLAVPGAPPGDMRWLPGDETPSLGDCVATIGPAPLSGSLRCPGDPASTTGSATLQMTWRPLP